MSLLSASPAFKRLIAGKAYSHPSGICGIGGADGRRTVATLALRHWHALRCS